MSSSQESALFWALVVMVLIISVAVLIGIAIDNISTCQ